MRLDLFLKASRLCARRTIAQKFCEAGRIYINGHTAKSSHEVKIGDEIRLKRPQALTTIRVLSVPATRQTSRKEAGTLYEIIREESLPETSVYLPEAIR
jgi:ribosomal 50S subunit-recycling heat shock protein